LRVRAANLASMSALEAATWDCRAKWHVPHK